MGERGRGNSDISTAEGATDGEIDGRRETEGVDGVMVDCEGVTSDEVTNVEGGKGVTDEGGGVGSMEERGGSSGEEDEREERRERDAEAREEEERDDSCWR